VKWRKRSSSRNEEQQSLVDREKGEGIAFFKKSPRENNLSTSSLPFWLTLIFDLWAGI
jgi:hypothetical protein